ncbi:MAG: CHASE domain-containing protein [Novosphingobium sp.]|jgi:two-component sensor histidine kinase|nr:CHASE domain-containing protein [Novosphingobium sp.]
MDTALLTRADRPAWFHRYPRGWPLLLFLLTSAGTILAISAIERAEAGRRQLELDRNATEISSGLQRRASENVAVLRAGGALFATEDKIGPGQFAGIAAGLYAGGDYRGLRGIGWVKWMPAGEIPAFEAAMNRISPGYRVYPRPDAGRSMAAPVVWFEPQSESSRAVPGFDMYSETVRRQAMNAAAQHAQPVASGKVHLVGDRNRPGVAGFLIYMPVFRGTGAERHLRGFVYSAFRAGEFLDSAVALGRDRDIGIALYDEVRRPDRLLAARGQPGGNVMAMDRRITVADRTWIVRVSVRREAALAPLSRVTLLFGLVLGLLVMFIARLITRRSAEDHEVLEWFARHSAIRTSLTRELNHRVKNTLANVLSIVALTRRRSVDLNDFAESLTGRIRALSATHDLLSQSDWTNVPIGEIVRSELAPYMAPGDRQVEMAGPDVSLAPNDALSLGLAIYELATNAAKYGALSTVDGRIFIDWKLVEPELVELHWRETGGPTVAVPMKRGFGRNLLEKIVAHELQSAVELRFDPGGVECTLRVPVRRLTRFALRGSGEGQGPPG